MQNIDASSIAFSTEQRDRLIYGKLTWDGIPSADFSRYEVQYKPDDGVTAWSSVFTTEPEAYFPVIAELDYILRVRAESTNGIQTAWARPDIESVTIASRDLNLSITRNGDGIQDNNYQLPGTISTVADDATVTGTDTSFVSYLFTGDKILINGTEYTVLSVTSNTEIELTTNATETLTDVNYYFVGIVFNGNILVGEGEDKIRFIETGWQLSDYDGGTPQVFEIKNTGVAADSFFRGLNLIASFSSVEAQVIGRDYAGGNEYKIRLKTGSSNFIDINGSTLTHVSDGTNDYIAVDGLKFDTAVDNNNLLFLDTDNVLKYRDSGGTVHALW